MNTLDLLLALTIIISALLYLTGYLVGNHPGGMKWLKVFWKRTLKYICWTLEHFFDWLSKIFSKARRSL